jgi:hypothetical protein
MFTIDVRRSLCEMDEEGHDRRLVLSMPGALVGHQIPSLRQYIVTAGDALDCQRNRGTQVHAILRPKRSGCQVAAAHTNLQQPCGGLYYIILYCAFLYLSYVIANMPCSKQIHIVSLVAALNAAILLLFSHRHRRLAVFIQRSFHKHILNSAIVLTRRLSEIAGPRETLLYNVFTNRSHKVRVRSVWPTTHPPQPPGRKTISLQTMPLRCTIVSP